MIVRIVKMTFKENEAETFKGFVKSIRNTIRNFDGCLHLDIYRDIQKPNVFFSYSHWISEEHLENYRKSEFFKKTWAQTKKWFDAEPLAWSVEKI